MFTLEQVYYCAPKHYLVRTTLLRTDNLVRNMMLELTILEIRSQVLDFQLFLWALRINVVSLRTRWIKSLLGLLSLCLLRSNKIFKPLLSNVVNGSDTL